MSEQFYISDDEAARRLGINRKSVDSLIRIHKSDFEELGLIRIKIEKEGNSGRPEKYYLLTTKEQWWLLVMYSRSTIQSRKVKKQIITEMFNNKGERSL
ncbi:hypothetical protein [Enterococcus casseliflavus]|uniref:hypothetical protein n=1 Tax=Enterococcus casseliflavus TaxID=37734 RepID=UPI0028917F1A|nr:hypothetical protein [Enterococcus casseliflavus]MDT2990057.1 hypothetical protein [Enterococcus casseliflavus]